MTTEKTFDEVFGATREAPVETTAPAVPAEQTQEAAPQAPSQQPVVEEIDGIPVDQIPEKLLKTVRATREERDTEMKARKEAEERAREHERELIALRAKQDAYREMRPQPEAPKGPQAPNFYDDPEGYHAFHSAELEKKFNEREWQNRANMSEELISEKYVDYAQAKEVFLAKADQYQVQRMRAAAMPAKVVYEEGKRMLSGEPNDEFARMKARNAELEAMLASQGAPAQPKPLPAIPPSTASARGTGINPNAAKREYTFEEVFSAARH